MSLSIPITRIKRPQSAKSTLGSIAANPNSQRIETRGIERATNILGGREAKLCYLGDLMTESRQALIVDARLTVAAGTAELESALAMVADTATAYNVMRIPQMLAATG